MNPLSPFFIPEISLDPRLAREHPRKGPHVDLEFASTLSLPARLSWPPQVSTPPGRPRNTNRKTKILALSKTLGSPVWLSRTVKRLQGLGTPKPSRRVARWGCRAKTCERKGAPDAMRNLSREEGQPEKSKHVYCSTRVGK